MVLYAEDHFKSIESRRDDCPPYGQDALGYGRKISMPYLVRLDGKGPWRRVYAIQYSNSGSPYVLVGGEMYMFHCNENLRLEGVWPAG